MPEFRLEAVDVARRRDLTPIPPLEDVAADEPEDDEAEEEPSSWTGPTGWDPQRARGVPILFAGSWQARRDELPHVAGIEAADRALALRGEARRLLASETNGGPPPETRAAAVARLRRAVRREVEKLRQAAAALPSARARSTAIKNGKPPPRALYTSSHPFASLPPILRVLHRRADAAVDLIRAEGVTDEGERLLLLSYVVWPGERDPDYAGITTGEVVEAGQAELDAFLEECCELGVGETDTGAVGRAFAEWCAARGLVAPDWRTVVSGRYLFKRGIRAKRVYVAASARGGRDGVGEHRYMLPLTLRAA